MALWPLLFLLAKIQRAETERESASRLSSAGSSPPKWLQQPGTSQSEARRLVFHLGLSAMLVVQRPELNSAAFSGCIRSETAGLEPVLPYG